MRRNWGAHTGRSGFGPTPLPRSGPAAGEVARDLPRLPDPGQNWSDQELIRPVSRAATSWTRSFQTPFATSPEAFTE